MLHEGQLEQKDYNFKSEQAWCVQVWRCGNKEIKGCSRFIDYGG